MSRRLLFTALILQLSSLALVAQRSAVDVRVVHYDVRNGLLDSKLTDGEVDAYGGLWLVSQQGLSHFDGVRFTNFTMGDPMYTLSSARIKDILSSDDYLYVASDSTIDRIHVLSKVVTPLPYIHKNKYVSELIVDRQGRIFVLDELGYVTDIASGRSVSIGFKSVLYSHVHLGDSNEVVISGVVPKQVAIVDLSTLSLKELWSYRRSVKEVSRGLVYGKKHGLMHILSSGVVRVHPQDGQETPLTSYPPDLTHYLEIGSGDLLVSTAFNSLKFIDDDSRISPVQLLSSNDVVIQKMLTDGNRTIFLLHSQGLTAFRLPPPFVKILPIHPQSFKEPNILFKGMLEKPDRSILLFMFRHILEYNPSTETVTFTPAPPNFYVTGVMRDQSIYASTDGKGLLELSLDLRGPEIVHRLDDSTSTEHTYHIYQDEDGILVGYTNPFGLWRFDPKSRKFSPIQFPPPYVSPDFNAVNNIIRDRQGFYWVATNKGLFCFDPEWNIVRHFVDPWVDSPSSPGAMKVNQVFMGSDGAIWLATGDGLRTKALSDSVFHSVNEFTSEVIASMEEDSFGRLWLATYHGLAVHDPKLKRTLRFYHEDGFADNEYNIGSHLRASDSTLYFGGLNGVVQIDPSLLEMEALATTLHLSSITVENNQESRLESYTDLESDPIELVGISDLLTIRVSYMEYINPTYSTYRYRIVGYDERWLRFDGGTLRLRNLPVGEHVIEITGSHASGAVVDEPVRVMVRVTEPFVRSTAFIILVVLFVVSLVAGFLYYRHLQIVSLRTIKSNLLNDIHDELGGIMTKAAMKTELIASQESVAKEDLRHIQQLYKEGMQSLRNLLWNISSEDSTTQQFQDRITDWLGLIFEGTGIRFTFENRIPEAKLKLSVQQRRQLLPIIKELAVNSMKHSNGGQFQLVLDTVGGKYQLIASDDGKNAEPDISVSGFGIKGIKSRTNTLGGTVTFEKTKNGFKTIITF